MNSLPKLVASTTLQALDWANSTAIQGDVAAEIARLKQEPGQDIIVFGSVTLVNYLAQHDLVDLYRLLVYPIVLGSGRRLFDDGTRVTLKRTVAEPLGPDVLHLSYEPAREAACEAACR
jgi:dihydrofolate reductase